MHVVCIMPCVWIIHRVQKPICIFERDSFVMLSLLLSKIVFKSTYVDKNNRDKDIIFFLFTFSELAFYDGLSDSNGSQMFAIYSYTVEIVHTHCILRRKLILRSRFYNFELTNAKIWVSLFFLLSWDLSSSRQSRDLLNLYPSIIKIFSAIKASQGAVT